jgi:hypothetical protein
MSRCGRSTDPRSASHSLSQHKDHSQHHSRVPGVVSSASVSRLLQVLALEASTSGAELRAVERLFESQARATPCAVCCMPHAMLPCCMQVQEVVRWMQQLGCPVFNMDKSKSAGLLPMLDFFKINLRHMMTVSLHRCRTPLLHTCAPALHPPALTPTITCASLDASPGAP